MMMPRSDNQIISATKKWIEKVVIGHNFCPFAKTVFDDSVINYQVLKDGVAPSLELLLAACKQLDQNKKIETTLLIFPELFSSFEEYLDLYDLGNQLIEQQGYQGIYQLASFHPHYQFANSTKEDPANYTNRSPFPMIHILREDSIEKVLLTIPNPEAIPERNIQHARTLGLPFLKVLLENCQ